MTEKHTHQWQLLNSDYREDYGAPRVIGGHRPNRGESLKADVLSRSPIRPSVHAGSPCPHCDQGQMLKEEQMHEDAILSCLQCGFTSEDIDLNVMLELAAEVGEETLKRKPFRGKVPL